jgi:hypothetical protein
MHRRGFLTALAGAFIAPAFAVAAQTEGETFDDRWQRRVSVGGHLDVVPGYKPPVKAQAVEPVETKPTPKPQKKTRRARRKYYRRRKRRWTAAR